MKMNDKQRLTRYLLAAVCLALAAPLLVYAYTGTFSRHRADDFCHSGDIFEHGFWQAQIVVYLNSSDRFSVEPLVGLSELFGSNTIRLLPALAIVLWLAGTVWALSHLFHLLRLPVTLPAVLLPGEMLVFFTLFESPNLFQSLYWRAGMLTYLMPLVFNTFLAGIILKQMRRQEGTQVPIGQYVLIAVIAFFAGGFSETSAALQAGALMLALLFSVWQLLSKRRASKLLSMLAVALAATLLAMLVLFLSPAAHLRQSNFEAPPDLITLIQLSIQLGIAYLNWDTLRVVPLPILVSILMAALFSLTQLPMQQKDEKPWWHILLWMLLTLAVCVLLVICCNAPSIYVYRASMEPRAAITARWVTTVACLCLGWLAGMLIFRPARRYGLAAKLPLIAAVLLLAYIVYPLRAAFQAAALIPDYQARARAWDERDAGIRRDIAGGMVDIEAVELDSIGKIGDLKHDPELWVNVCAARYYGVQSIKTYLPE